MIQVVGATVVDLDVARFEAKVELTLSEAPSDRWMGIFIESGTDTVDTREIKVSDTTMTFWHRAESGAIVRQADAIRRLIELVDVKLELDVRTARQREERTQQRISELGRALQRGLGLFSDEPQGRCE